MIVEEIFKAYFRMMTFQSVGNVPRCVEIAVSIFGWFNTIIIIYSIYKIIEP